MFFPITTCNLCLPLSEPPIARQQLNTMSAQLPLRTISRSAAPRVAFQPSQHRISCFRPQRIQRLQAGLYSTAPPPVEAVEAAEVPRPKDLRSQFSSVPDSVYRQPRPKRSLRPYIYATIFLGLGLTAGSYIRFLLAPPPGPAPGTKKDKEMAEYLQRTAEKLPIVQSLSADPNWISYEAYSSLPEEERSHRLTTGPLGGARALGGFQRIFYNQESGELVEVVWFGGSIAGWPGVTHGGVTATIMDECLGRCAIRQFPSKTGVTANLELKYLKPIVTNAFYVVRAAPEAGYTDRKGWVAGRLETLDGRICVEAKGLFVVPKNYKTRVIAGEF